MEASTSTQTTSGVSDADTTVPLLSNVDILRPSRDLGWSAVNTFSEDKILENDLYWAYICIRKSLTLLESDERTRADVNDFKEAYPNAHAALSRICNERAEEWGLLPDEIKSHAKGLEAIFERRCANCEELVLEQQPGTFELIIDALKSASMTCEIYGAAKSIWHARESALRVNSEFNNKREDVWEGMCERRDVLLAQVHSLV